MSNDFLSHQRHCRYRVSINQALELGFQKSKKNRDLEVLVILKMNETAAMRYLKRKYVVFFMRFSQ